MRVQTLGYLVWQLGLRWRVAVDRALSPLGLTHAHYALLASLYGLSADGGSPSQRELADVAGLDVMYVSKLARLLEGAGHLRRRDHPDDPRAFQLDLTARGRQTTEQAAAVVRDVYVELLAPVGGATSARSAQLSRALNALLDRAEHLNAQGARPHRRASRRREA